MSGDWNPNELLGTQLGSCVLERTLGIGGMGAVYLAQQIRPRRQVAVKVLQPGITTSAQAWQVFLERFRREADIAAGLDHANIVPIYEFGEDGDIAFLVMPYLPDGSLADLLLTVGRLPLADALTYAEQVAAALDYAHAHGLVHRDVKPSNLLLHGDGRLMLADFGIACLVDDAAADESGRGEGSATTGAGTGAGTRAGAPAGTPEYMAPEQVRGAALTAATDIYALGIVTYAMLTGATPFGGVAPHLILARQLHEPPTSVRTLRPDLSQRLDETLAWALAKDPGARPQSATSFARALRVAASRSRPLGGLFARSATAQAPRGMLKMAADLAGMAGRSTPSTSRAARSSPLGAPVFAPIVPSSPLAARPNARQSASAMTESRRDSRPDSSPDNTPGRPPIPRRDNGTRPLDRSRVSGSSQPRLVSYDSEPISISRATESSPSADPYADAAPTLGPGYPGIPYASPYTQPHAPQYAPPYAPVPYPGSQAWPGGVRPPMGPPPRQRRHSALKLAAGTLVVIIGCVLLGTLGRTGLFAQNSPLPLPTLPGAHFAPTATALPTPTPTVPPNWVRVSPVSLSLTCKQKSNQAQITIRNLGNADLIWHIEAPGFSGLQFSKMNGDIPTGKSVAVTVKDVSWWDQQSTFTVVPDTDDAGDPATINYTAQGCPWGANGG